MRVVFVLRSAEVYPVFSDLFFPSSFSKEFGRPFPFWERAAIFFCGRPLRQIWRRGRPFFFADFLLPPLSARKAQETAGGLFSRVGHVPQASFLVELSSDLGRKGSANLQKAFWRAGQDAPHPQRMRRNRLAERSHLLYRESRPGRPNS